MAETKAVVYPSWEYKTVWLYVGSEEELNALGRLGWELVAVVTDETSVPKAYFKRRSGRAIVHAGIEGLTKRQRNEVLKIISDALVEGLR